MAESIPSLEPDVPGRDGRTGLLLRAPYRAGLVTELKERLPRPHRYWDAGIGAWWIDAREDRRVQRIVLHHFAPVAWLGRVGEEAVVLRAEGSRIDRKALLKARGGE
jgi:hypothetical protein